MLRSSPLSRRVLGTSAAETFEPLEGRVLLSGDIVSLRATDSRATEGGNWVGTDGGPGWTWNGFRVDNAVVVFERKGSGPLEALEVSYSIGGTAVSGADYPGLAGIMNFGVGMRSVQLYVNPYDDVSAEQTETLILTLNAGPSYSVHPTRRTATISIADDEPIVKISAKDRRATESSQGQDNGAFVISRSGRDFAHSLDVDLAFSGSAAAGDDFVSIPERVTIPAGQRSLLVPVSVIDDLRVESIELLTVSLNASDRYHLGKMNERTATVSIWDNEPLVFVSAGKAASEGASAPINGSFHFTRLSTDTAAPLTVYYSISGSSTATAGTDYEALDGVLVIPAGQKSASLVVRPFADGISEPTETITVSLTERDEYSLVAPKYRSATINIANVHRIDFLSAFGFVSRHSWDYSLAATVRAAGSSSSLTARLHAELNRSGTHSTWSFDITDLSEPDIDLALPSFTFDERSDGIYLDTLISEQEFNLGEGELKVSPRLLAGSLTDTSPIDLNLNGVTFLGTATSKTTLGGRALVTVPAGTFNADQLSLNLQLRGTGRADGLSARFSIMLSMTLFTVDGIGPVKLVENLSATVTARGESLSLSAKAVAELLRFD